MTVRQDPKQGFVKVPPANKFFIEGLPGNKVRMLRPSPSYIYTREDALDIIQRFAEFAKFTISIDAFLENEIQQNTEQLELMHKPSEAAVEAVNPEVSSERVFSKEEIEKLKSISLANKDLKTIEGKDTDGSTG